MVIGSPPLADDLAQHLGDEFIFAHADFDMLDQHVDGFADDLSGFLDEGDLFSAFHRADLLHEIGGVFELDGRQRGANLFKGSPRHDSFGRAHEAGEADDADALGADFFKRSMTGSP